MNVNANNKYEFDLIINNKIPWYVYSWIQMIIVLLTLIILIFSFYNYDKVIFIEGRVVKVEEKYYVNLFIEKNNLANLLRGDLIVMEKKVSFKIYSINKNYVVGYDNKVYADILISGNFESGLLYENNVLQTKWVVGKTTILKEISIILKKGLIGWND